MVQSWLFGGAVLANWWCRVGSLMATTNNRKFDPWKGARLGETTTGRVPSVASLGSNPWQDWKHV